MPALHLVITDIPSPDSPLRTALSGTPLPPLRHLARLLTDLQATQRIELDDFAWAMPHEALIARAVGLSEINTPWAALQTGTLGTACAWIHPVHWQVGMDHLTMSEPAALGFDEALSREYFAVLAPFFAEVGIALTWHEPLRWLATGEVFNGLPSASLDRTVGRNIDAWMPEAASAAGAQIRRLQNEVQMLLYNHPLTDAVQTAGRLPMNSFWVSGAGQLNALPSAPAPTLERRLQAPVWQQDAQTYRAAWQAIDAGPLAQLCTALDTGQPVTLSLCSDRVAQSFEVAPASLGRKLMRLFSAPKADWSRWL